MMPPHVSRTDPREGEPMINGQITLYGWTFGMTGTDGLRVTSRGKPVAFTSSLDSDWHGDADSDVMGSQQLASVLTIQIDHPEPGATYRVRFLDLDLRVVAAS